MPKKHFKQGKNTQSPPMKTAVLFDGAASLIGQEAAVFELLQERFGLRLEQDNTFIGGLSSGALMTFMTNVCFCDEPKMSWESLKTELLFPLTNDDVYIIENGSFDTTPLRNMLTDLQAQSGVKTFGDLPFSSSILTRSDQTLTTVWFNTLTDTIPPWDLPVHQQIRQHAAALDSVDALMCSTAIPDLFPSQNLRYYNDQNELTFIDTIFDQPAVFTDGGSSGTFDGFELFFDAYKETLGLAEGQHAFDNIYYITPDFVGLGESDLVEYLGEKAAKQGSKLQSMVSPAPAKQFAKSLQSYSDAYGLAENIFYCKPELSNTYNPINFNNEEVQFNDTKAWGNANPDDIAINAKDL